MFHDNHQTSVPHVASLLDRYGLHPLVASGMFALDHMLFGILEVPSLGWLIFVSVAVGLAAILPCALIQRYAYHDSMGAAWGKAMLVGLLTAVPTSLPAFFTAAWGVMGAIGLAERRRLSKATPPSALPPGDDANDHHHSN